MQPLEVAAVQDDDDDSVPLLRLAGLSGLAGRQRLLHGRALDVDADFREVEVRPEGSDQAAAPVATELELMRLVVPANPFAVEKLGECTLGRVRESDHGPPWFGVCPFRMLEGPGLAPPTRLLLVTVPAHSDCLQVLPDRMALNGTGLLRRGSEPGDERDGPDSSPHALRPSSIDVWSPAAPAIGALATACH